MQLRRKPAPLHHFTLLSVIFLPFACGEGTNVLNIDVFWGMLLSSSLLVKYPQGQQSFTTAITVSDANRTVSMSFEKPRFYHPDIKALKDQNSSLAMPGK